MIDPEFAINAIFVIVRCCKESGRVPLGDYEVIKDEYDKRFMVIFHEDMKYNRILYDNFISGICKKYPKSPIVEKLPDGHVGLLDKYHITNMLPKMNGIDWEIISKAVNESEKELLKYFV